MPNLVNLDLGSNHLGDHAAATILHSISECEPCLL
jgi:hypothetical protein